jgi:hypothetical protein
MGAVRAAHQPRRVPVPILRVDHAQQAQPEARVRLERMELPPPHLAHHEVLQQPLRKLCVTQNSTTHRRQRQQSNTPVTATSVSVGGAAVESGVRWPPGAAHASRRRAVQSLALPPSLSSLPPARPSARASGCEPFPPLGAWRGSAADTDRGFCPQLHAHSQELLPQLHCEDKADRQQAAAHDENPLADAHDALRALPHAEPLELLAAQLQATRMTRPYDVERGTCHAIQYMRRTRNHARTRTHSTANTLACRAHARTHARYGQE